MTTPVSGETALEAFLGRAVSDAGAALPVLLTHPGYKPGLYAAMGDSRLVTAAESARRTSTDERLVAQTPQNFLYETRPLSTVGSAQP